MPAESKSGYRNPTPTVDAIIEIDDRSGNPCIVLIRRKNEPVGWALPGGFVDYGERLSAAAAREALEETGLKVEVLELFHSYSNPERDPRQHTISAVFITRAAGEPVGADDADEAHLFPRDQLPSPVVFDHALIIDDYFRYRDTGERPPPDR